MTLVIDSEEILRPCGGTLMGNALYCCKSEHSDDAADET